MSYELTAILNRCTKDDAKFLIDTIDSYLNITDDKGLKELFASWEGDGPMPRVLNHKIETEIRYLGSNDFAYMTRKLRGYEPAGVSVDEIIDDLCKLLKLEISTAHTLDKLAIEYISAFCYELTKSFENVYFYNVSGNHSRLNPNKDNAVKDERLDDLIGWTVCNLLKHIDNFHDMTHKKFDSTIGEANIRNKNYLLIQ